jgi:hypothetical protein
MAGPDEPDLDKSDVPAPDSPAAKAFQDEAPGLPAWAASASPPYRPEAGLLVLRQADPQGSDVQEAATARPDPERRQVVTQLAEILGHGPIPEGVRLGRRAVQRGEAQEYLVWTGRAAVCPG